MYPYFRSSNLKVSEKKKAPEPEGPRLLFCCEVRLLGDEERNFFLSTTLVAALVLAVSAGSFVGNLDVLLTFVSDNLTGFLFLASLLQ